MTCTRRVWLAARTNASDFWSLNCVASLLIGSLMTTRTPSSALADVLLTCTCNLFITPRLRGSPETIWLLTLGSAMLRESSTPLASTVATL